MTDDGRGQTTLDFALGVTIFLLTIVFVFSFVPGMLEPFTASTQEETAASDRLADQLAKEMLVADPSEPYRLDRECTVIFFESREDGFDPAGDDQENVDGDGVFGEPFGTAQYSGSCNFEDVPLEERLGLVTSSGLSPDVRVRLVRDMTTGEADDPDDDGNDQNDGDPDDEDPETLCIDENSESRIVEGHTPFTEDTECDLTRSTPTSDDDVLFEIGRTPPTDTRSVVVSRRYVHVEGGFADGTNDAILVVEVW